MHRKQVKIENNYKASMAANVLYIDIGKHTTKVGTMQGHDA